MRQTAITPPLGLLHFVLRILRLGIAVLQQGRRLVFAERGGGFFESDDPSIDVFVSFNNIAMHGNVTVAVSSVVHINSETLCALRRVVKRYRSASVPPAAVTSIRKRCAEC